ncbi:outer membrane beta-barrel protein [Chryseobacterium echinoideorum]|uniref:outer membrane beta-barrel protein n=1 Tax=Chryseobacterium echinoideorum TaxID=1549648 RepID=UPI00162AB692|nr:outer membrane beta-barrel protein [Chryseobacterium echinoideorum]
MKKLLFFLFILFSIGLQAQRKKTDTIYIYEKIIVYDTIYIEKAISLPFKDIQFSTPQIAAIELNDLHLPNNFQDNSQNLLKKSGNGFQYGIEAGVGLKKVSWANDFSDNPSQFGQNLGIWISKNLFLPQLSVLFSANIQNWNSNFDLDANKEETYLNGFYFTKNNEPLLFQRFKNQHFEYLIHLKLLYEWKKLRPFVGIAVNKNIYKMQFMVPENDVLNRLDDFKSKNINFGYTLGVQYRLYGRLFLNFEYQQFIIKNLSLKNSAFDFDIFKPNNTFAERKFLLGISYQIR